MSRYGQAPSSLNEVLELGRAVRKDGKWLGLPLVPTDAMCTLLTMTDPQDGEEFFAADEVVHSIDQLRQLAALSHPDSSKWNPIRCYDHMIASDDVVYVPFAFGYVNYASKPDAPHLLFADVPASGSSAPGPKIARLRWTMRCSCARPTISAATM
jgi:multiple sugar transport system substrate-binding protein